MNQAHWHTFQVLTKRAERLFEVSTKVKWTSNIWAGVTVELEEYKYRIDLLKKSRLEFVLSQLNLLWVIWENLTCNKFIG